MRELLTADINARYAAALHYPQVDRFMIRVLWWHWAALVFLTVANTVFQLGRYFPSPFSWRIPTLEEGAGTITVGLFATIAAAWAHGRLHNHYAWRILVSVSLTTYFVPLRAHQRRLDRDALPLLHDHGVLVVYSDWRPRVAGPGADRPAPRDPQLTSARTGCTSTAGNDFAIVAHGLPVAVMAVFTTMLCQNQRRSVAILEDTRRAQEQDLIKRREAEETLRESEEKSRYIIDSAADAIVSIDDESRVREFNHAASGSSASTAAEIAGEPLARLIPARADDGHRTEPSTTSAGRRTGGTSSSWVSPSPAGRSCWRRRSPGSRRAGGAS